MSVLKETNAFGYYEIRLEAVGGMGANLCGKLLGELGSMGFGLYAQNFSSYGSEKRGSPVQSHIRYANKEILINSQVHHPHILCVFHENLLQGDALNLLDNHTYLIVNTKRKPKEILQKIKRNVKEIYCVDGVKLANEANARVNVVLLGTIARAMGFVTLEDVEQVIIDNIGKKYPNSIRSNLLGVKLGFTQYKKEELQCQEQRIPTLKKSPLWGYNNAPIGGINPQIGNSISNDLSCSREGYIPVFIEERCIHCGLCDSTCPDYVFQFAKQEVNGKVKYLNLGLDYHHCKGCMRCVNVCPTEALVARLEEDVNVEKLSIQNISCIQKKISYTPIGASSYITSESENNIKNFKGGHF